VGCDEPPDRLFRSAERGATPSIEAEAVVGRFRSVDADPDADAMLDEGLDPALVEQRPVRLNRQRNRGDRLDDRSEPPTRLIERFDPD
jgi:hypothetical protein